MNSEVEIEHAFVKGDEGELEMEQLYLEQNLGYLGINDTFIKYGTILMPVGITNETHEPPTFYGVERNTVEKVIGANTWWEAGILGQTVLQENLDFTFAVHSSLDTTTGDIRDGRGKIQEQDGTNLMYTARVRYTGIPGIAAIREARRALDDVGKTGKVTLIYAGGVRDGADMAKALALGADAIAIGTGSMIALNCNKDIPEANFEKEMGVKAGECYHCHTGRCPVGVATQDPKLRARLNPDDAALRVYNYLHSMTLEAQLLARACGKTNIHSLEPEDLAALTSEASALAKVPLAGTNYTVGVDNYHKI